MLAAERHHLILKEIRDNGIAQTSQLATQLQCTKETIRRDLDKLTQEGLVARTHGGAMGLNEINKDIHHHTREQRHINEKSAIAKAAAQLISPDETIMVDDSSTCLALIDALPREGKIKIVTYSFLVAQKIIQQEYHQLIQIGGEFDPLSMSFHGLLSDLSISRLKIDRFFCSCKGIDLSQGLSEPNMERARMKQLIMQYANWNCALVDHTKMGIRSNYFFGTEDAIDLIITDKKTSGTNLKEIAKTGTHYVVA